MILNYYLRWYYQYRSRACTPTRSRPGVSLNFRSASSGVVVGATRLYSFDSRLAPVRCSQMLKSPVNATCVFG